MSSTHPVGIGYLSEGEWQVLHWYRSAKNFFLIPMADTTQELRQLLLNGLSEFTSQVSHMGTQLAALGERVDTLSHDVHTLQQNV